MNKKGFTLVELLAVIAILAILVIIALPNVLKMFNDSKKNSFLTEAKTIYSEVSKKYITESMKGNKLTYISSEDNTKLNMTGKELQYCVLLNDDGSVSEMKVSNGTWVATLPKGKKITDLTANDLTDGNLDGYKCGNGSSGGSTVLPTKSFEEETSWKTIASNAKNCVDNPDSCAYEVGQTKTIEMGTLGTHTLRIANMSTPDDCNTEGFSQSACGFVVEFTDIITMHNMNPSGEYNGKTYQYGWNKGGWPASSMYTYLNNDIYNALSDDLKGVIKDTVTVSGHGSDDTDNFTSTDKLYLLAPKEIYTDWSDQYDTAKEKTRQLDYYKNMGVTTSNCSGAIKKNNGTTDWWLLRPALSSYGSGFCSVNHYGDWNDSGANVTNGVSPAFRIG